MDLDAAPKTPTDQGPTASKATTATEGEPSEGGAAPVVKAAAASKKRGTKRGRNLPTVDADLQIRWARLGG